MQKICPVTHNRCENTGCTSIGKCPLLRTDITPTPIDKQEVDGRIRDWVDAEKQSPENRSTVLAHGGGHMETMVYKHGCWYYAYDDLKRAYDWVITHWMPLPEKPKSK